MQPKQDMLPLSEPVAQAGVLPRVLGRLWYYRLLLRLLMALIGLPTLVLGVWLSLKRSGNLDLHLPRWFVHWYNHSGELRNLPAYFILGLLAFASVPFRFRRLMLYGLLSLATGLEICQIWMPSRSFDLVDIGLSWVGLLFALLLHQVLRERFRRGLRG